VVLNVSAAYVVAVCTGHVLSWCSLLSVDGCITRVQGLCAIATCLCLFLRCVLFCSRRAVKMASGHGPSRRRCVNNPDCFCYTCGCYVIKMQKSNITSFVKKAYYAYFKVTFGDQDKGWAPHVVCNTCVEGLIHWYQRSSMPFGIRMVWRQPQNHYDDC
jgi:hypothetical protein